MLFHFLAYLNKNTALVLARAGEEYLTRIDGKRENTIRQLENG
jgi:hypothetical protein